MIPQSRPLKSKNPCSICSRRKVKCDRLIPCSNCVKRGQGNECKASNKMKLAQSGDSYSQQFLSLWPSYDYWVLNLGLFKAESIEKNAWYDMQADMDEAHFWKEYLTMDVSLKLLDYSMENLGGLYFGCIGDIGEVYVQLERFGSRRESSDEWHSVDDYLWDAVLWAIFTMSVYYMPKEVISGLLPPESVSQWCYERNDRQWSEELKFNLFKGFLKTSIQHLKLANFLAHPDVKVIQTYLILATTSFVQLKRSFANSTLNHCLHLAKLLRMDRFRPLVTDSTDLRLTKMACERMWYRLCTHDYWQSGPNKPITIHEENSSLLNHAAFLMNRPNVDVYQSEDTYEALLWKIISLDRDLERYSATNNKPPLKTLDAVNRQVEIFSHKVSSLDASDSVNSKLEKFTVKFYLNAVSWKLSTLMFIYFDTFRGMSKCIQYTRLLIGQLLKNIKAGNAYFNEIPMIIIHLARVGAFHCFCYIFEASAENEQVIADIQELFANLNPHSNPVIPAALQFIERLKELRMIWRGVQVIDDGDSLNHPVVKILKNDIELFTKQYDEIPLVFFNVPNPLVRVSIEDEASESREFMQIVLDFQNKHDIVKIISANSFET